MASWHSQPAFNAQGYGQQADQSGQNPASILPNPSQTQYSQATATYQQPASSYHQQPQQAQTSFPQQSSPYQPATYASQTQAPSGYQMPSDNYYQTNPGDKSGAGVLGNPAGYGSAYTQQPGVAAPPTVDAPAQQAAGSSAWSNRVASAPAVTPVSGMIGAAPQARSPVLTGGTGHAENYAGRMAPGWAQPEAESASGWLHGGGSNGLLKDVPTSYGTQKSSPYGQSGGIYKPQASVATPGLWQPPPQLLDQRPQAQGGALDARRDEREMDLKSEEMAWQKSWSENSAHPDQNSLHGQGAGGQHAPHFPPEHHHPPGMSNSPALHQGQYNPVGEGMMFDRQMGLEQEWLGGPPPLDMTGPGPAFGQREQYGGIEFHGPPSVGHPRPKGFGMGPGFGRRPRGPWGQDSFAGRPAGQKRNWKQSNMDSRFQKPYLEPRAKRSAAGFMAQGQGIDPSSSRGWCDFCKMDCGTLDALQDHVNGKRHKRKLKLVEEEKEKAEADAAKAAAGPEAKDKESTQAAEGQEQKAGEEAAATEEQAAQSYFCKICLVECSGLGNLREHRLGRKHKKELDRLRSRGEFVDDSIPPELVEAMAAEAKAKMAEIGSSGTRLHGYAAQAAAAAVLAQTISADAALASGMAIEVGPEFQCVACNIPCNSRQMLESHLNGKKHKAKLESLSEDGKKESGEDNEEGKGEGTPSKKSMRKAKRGLNKAKLENEEGVECALVTEVISDAVGQTAGIDAAVSEAKVHMDAAAVAEGSDVNPDAPYAEGDVKVEATGIDGTAVVAADAKLEAAGNAVGGSGAGMGPDLNVMFEVVDPEDNVKVELVDSAVDIKPEVVDPEINTKIDVTISAVNVEQGPPAPEIAGGGDNLQDTAEMSPTDPVPDLTA